MSAMAMVSGLTVILIVGTGGILLWEVPTAKKS